MRYSDRPRMGSEIGGRTPSTSSKPMRCLLRAAALTLGLSTLAVLPPAGARATPPPAVEAATTLVTGGRLAEAIAALEAAETTATGTERLEIRTYRASILARDGRLAEGRRLLTDVGRAVMESGDAGLSGRWHRYMARVEIDAGDEPAAERSLARAVAVLERSGADPRGLDLARFSLAAIRRGQSDVEAAYAGFAAVLESSMQRKDRDLEAKTLMALGYCLLHYHRGDLARPLLEDAVALFRALGNHLSGRVAEARLAYALHLEGRAEDAQRTIRAAVDRPGELGANEWSQVLWPALLLAAEGGDLDAALATAAGRLSTPAFREAAAPRSDVLLAMASALTRAGRYVEARVIVDALDPGTLIARHRAEYDYVTGLVAAWEGDTELASAALRRALDDAERPAREAPHETLLRFAENPWVRTATQRLVDVELRRGRAAEALRVIGGQKARALTVAVVRSVGVGAVAPTSRAEPGRSVVEAVRALQRPRGPLRRIAVDPAASVVLPPGRLGVEYFVDGRRLHGFLVRGATVRHAVLTEDVETLRASTSAFVAELEHRRPDWQRPAAALGATLLGPFAEAIREAATAGDRLTVVPHGFLHAVPFVALVLGDAPLIDLLPVDEAPSLRVAAGADAAPRRAGVRGPLLIGAVATAEAGGNTLPGAAREIEEVHALLGGTRLTGLEATESAFVARAGAAGRILVAVHGFPARGGRAGHLELAPSATHDGRLDAHDVMALDLTGAEVFLSACETAVGDLDPADEMWGILDRAFLLAGARTVVSTKWPVDDAATRRLVTAYFARVDELGPLGALRDAQMHLRRGEAPAAAQLRVRGIRTVAAPAQTRYEHPYFWSGFKLMGAAR